ncbi:Hemerythrin HHE cation binding domain-containing protein [Actinacidiphila yanglinensis]|uniref:Hemerythrin HHE cation binding domain-containing protein n=1 Tax=Actinacidiphila yanglinensis TaxID=310779 RepID=A0A1H6D4C8_9ACTN|nr:hemerythrin domain-containing protein [Actinacidiphila yanglinensis]SEG79818.1 Hemerythrin HHE cation binding domain-containing protein [Actinacidiphila yanglinensis]
MTETQRIVTANRPDTINFTEMYVTHDGFRRDLARFAAAVSAGRGDAPAVRQGWQNFKRQLDVHHTVEDAWLWPRLKNLVAGRPDDLLLLEEMEAEHAVLDPLLAEVERALHAGAAELPVLVQKLRDTLEVHLRHEEDAALPLIQSVMTPADWKGFSRAMARKQKLGGASIWVPWITDGMAPADARKFLARLPAPLRLLNRLSWDGRYRSRGLWSY